MDKEKVRLLLDSYQPSLGSQGDAEMEQALQQAADDPELKEWFADQQAFDARICEALGGVPIPANLRSQILAGAPAGRQSFWQSNGGRVLAMAAAFAIFLGVSAVLFRFAINPSPENSVADKGSPSAELEPWQISAFENLEGGYKLEWHSAQGISKSSIREMQDFLKARGAPVPSEVLASLQDDQIIGCLKLNTTMPMSQICFTNADGQVMHIITMQKVADEAAENTRLAQVDSAQQPRFGGRGEWSFASWADQEASYMLVTRGAAEPLRDFL